MNNTAYIPMAIMGLCGEIASIYRSSALHVEDHLNNMIESKTREICYWMKELALENGNFNYEHLHEYSQKKYTRFKSPQPIPVVIRSLIVAATDLDQVIYRDGIQQKYLNYYCYPILEKLFLLWRELGMGEF
jgi:hypothetical protein